MSRHSVVLFEFLSAISRDHQRNIIELIGKAGAFVVSIRYIAGPSTQRWMCRRPIRRSSVSIRYIAGPSTQRIDGRSTPVPEFVSIRYIAGPSTQPSRTGQTGGAPSFYPLYRGTINATLCAAALGCSKSTFLSAISRDHQRNPGRQNRRPTRGFGTSLHTNRCPTSLPTELWASKRASSLVTGPTHVAPRRPRHQPQNAAIYGLCRDAGGPDRQPKSMPSPGPPQAPRALPRRQDSSALHPVRHPPPSVSSSTGTSTSPDRASAGTSPCPPRPHPSCTPAGSSPPRRPAGRSDRRRSR